MAQPADTWPRVGRGGSRAAPTRNILVAARHRRPCHRVGSGAWGRRRVAPRGGSRITLRRGAALGGRSHSHSAPADGRAAGGYVCAPEPANVLRRPELPRVGGWCWPCPPLTPSCAGRRRGKKPRLRRKRKRCIFRRPDGGRGNRQDDHITPSSLPPGEGRASERKLRAWRPRPKAWAWAWAPAQAAAAAARARAPASFRVRQYTSAVAASSGPRRCSVLGGWAGAPGNV